MGRWDGQVAWLTGGGTGLGKHMAVELARGGANVAVSGRRQSRLDEAVAAIEEAGGQGLAVVCDVTDEASIEAAVATVVDHFGRLDVAIANAGYGCGGRVEELSAAEWRKQLDVNVVGAALTAARAIPHLRETKGRVALVGSVSALFHVPKEGPYQASKAAVLALGNTLSAELAADGISCTTIHPGFVKSEIHTTNNSGEYVEGREDRRPKQLLWETEDAARVMVNAIWRRKREFVFTGHGRLGWFLARHFPGFTSFVARRV